MKRIRRSVGRAIGISMLAGAFAACSASGSSPAGGTGAGGAGSGAGSGTGAESTTTGLGGGFVTTTISTGTGTGTGGVESCAGISASAEAKLQPADIIIAVDTSGSMNEESAQVQANLNAFATIITQSGIDVHVVLIADSSVCIPAPLGSGQCGGGDEKLPVYRHVDQGVGSNNALELVINTYPQWKDVLRPEASKTIAVVSDDESDMSAAVFTSQLLALDPPTFQGFKFDGIVSSTESDSCPLCLLNCAACLNPCCNKFLFCAPTSAAEGKVYKDLIAQTGGVYGDLCLQNFAPVFMDMATAVVQGSQLSCEYDIPPPPAMQQFDPGKVNVKYSPGGGAPVSILNVPDPSACGMKGGWYYDNPASPTKIIVCPTTCATLKADSSGKVDVLFGCQTEYKPPE